MIDRVHKAVWKAAVERADLGRLEQALRAEALPCFRLASMVREDYAQIGHSRLGGELDLPPDFAWPLDDGVPMTFLAQINLADLTPGFEPDMPYFGRLYSLGGGMRRSGTCPTGSVSLTGRQPLPPDVSRFDSYSPRRRKQPPITPIFPA